MHEVQERADAEVTIQFGEFGRRQGIVLISRQQIMDAVQVRAIETEIQQGPRGIRRQVGVVGADYPRQDRRFGAGGFESRRGHDQTSYDAPRSGISTEDSTWGWSRGARASRLSGSPWTRKA